MRFKPGDRVIVSGNLIEGEYYGGICFRGSMLDLKNKMVTISAVGPNGYFVCGCGSMWSDEMFEPISGSKKNKSLPKLETGMFGVMGVRGEDTTYLFVIVNDYIVYQTNGYDLVKDFQKTGIYYRSFIKALYEPGMVVSFKLLEGAIKKPDIYPAIYTHQNVFKMTKAQIEEELGYTIEIVDEN